MLPACRLRGYQDINFGSGPAQGPTGVSHVQQVAFTSVISVFEGTALRLVLSPEHLARLKQSPVLSLLPHSSLMRY